MYEERFYRTRSLGKHSLEVAYKESDLFVATDTKVDIKLLHKILEKYYCQIEEYIKQNPQFLTSLSPLRQDERAPLIVQDMLKVSQATAVGPFASVAGAIALYVGRELLTYCQEVIIENGGDLFLKINSDKRLGVYLGDRYDLQNITLKIHKQQTDFGIASSSAFIGPSLNFGKADLAMVIAKDAILADGFATALSNRIKEEKDVAGVMDSAKNNELIQGLLVFFEGKIFLWGEFSLEQ